MEEMRKGKEGEGKGNEGGEEEEEEKEHEEMQEEEEHEEKEGEEAEGRRALSEAGSGSASWATCRIEVRASAIDHTPARVRPRNISHYGPASPPASPLARTIPDPSISRNQLLYERHTNSRRRRQLRPNFCPIVHTLMANPPATTTRFALHNDDKSESQRRGGSTSSD